MLSYLITPLSIIFTLGLLVTIHEYGHFQVAKWCGVKVLKFSIGFGKPLWRRKFGLDQTEFVLAAIPLGGYVKMLDEREMQVDTEAEFQFSEKDLCRAFNRQSVYKRILIVLAGPAANLILAITLYFVLFSLGVDGLKPILGKVVENSPAASANMRSGEMLRKINGKAVSTWQDAGWLLLNASIISKTIDIETTDSQQLALHHQLNLSQINLENSKVDVLDQLGLIPFRGIFPPLIGLVVKGGRGDLAGLQVNDLIISVNHHSVIKWEDFVDEIKRHPGLALDLNVLRDQKEMLVTVTPESANEDGKAVGRIGVGLNLEKAHLDKIYITQHYSFGRSLIKATEKTWDTSIFSLKMLGNMVTGHISWKSMSGPVAIAGFAGESAHLGLKAFVSFLALISISIGVLNLLPLPVLDGGHFMYYVIEIVSGKPVSEAVMIIGQKVGFTLLGLMMFLALYNDINRLITG